MALKTAECVQMRKGGRGMDKIMEGLIEFASVRGSRYVKGEVALDEMPLKMAEMGTLLLLYSKRMKDAPEQDMRAILKDLQPYIDDFRRLIFDKKNSGY
jgi:hypothetical protein